MASSFALHAAVGAHANHASVLQEDLTKQWRGEKDDMERLQSVKEEIDRVNLEIQGAERDYDLNRAAELKYGTLMDLQKQLKGAEVALEKQVSNASYCYWAGLPLVVYITAEALQATICPASPFQHHLQSARWGVMYHGVFVDVYTRIV